MERAALYLIVALLSTTLLVTGPRSTQAQKQGKAVHESPYYLPGLSHIPFNFSGAQSAEGSGAFRVLGATTDGLSLSFTHAEASCLALEGGQGLALVNSAQRRAALNAAIIKPMVSTIHQFVPPSRHRRACAANRARVFVTKPHINVLL